MRNVELGYHRVMIVLWRSSLFDHLKIIQDVEWREFSVRMPARKSRDSTRIRCVVTEIVPVCTETTESNDS